MNYLDNMLNTKAELLCWGLKTSKAADEIYLIQHPTAHKRTGNAGIHIILDDNYVINSIYGEPFCEKSPYSIEKIKDRFYLYKNNKHLCGISVIKAPEWYKKSTTDGHLMADVFLQEGKDILITGLWNNCCYFNNETQCKFCVLGHQKDNGLKNINHFVETVLAAQKEKPDYSLHLTGGNTPTPDHGIKYYEKYVKAIRKESNIPISLEISPPEDMKDIDDLVSAGVNGFSINIEIWDEIKRKQICPGKSEIKREQYFKSWQRSTKLLGEFKTSSVIIVGLDTPNNIEKAINEMITVGVKPVLIPFRPFMDSQLHHLNPPDPAELLKLSKFAGDELMKAGANTKDFVGCEKCGACTIEKDFMRTY